MTFENKAPTKEVEMQTMNGLEYVSHIRLSWKECFNLWLLFGNIQIIVFVLLSNFFP
ncbi:hypothetical protein [uncultured Methanolobus sp.]|uniref:hypothetical protein n=1 Tax=uncultured Methanolobus sp. TaxID=218300 RepID=UPI002AAA7DBC|nr:hypothetical protein [uncultured Methanolobus sp.]